MTNLLLDIEPRDPAPRCPHCAALAAAVFTHLRLELIHQPVTLSLAVNMAIMDWLDAVQDNIKQRDLTDAAPERKPVLP